MSDIARLLHTLRERGQTLACAESLTGGLLCATLVEVPGASDVVRGGVVAYAADLKTTLLGVGEQVLARHGTVSEPTARAMSTGAAEHLGATYGLATTGVAGPDASEGKPAGTVHIAVFGPEVSAHAELRLVGNRQSVREQAVAAVVGLLVAQL